MRQVGVVSWLAMRELWVSYRLLVLLGAFVAAGAFVAIVPDVPAVLHERFSLGLGLAVGVAAAVAAWSIARERELGRAGWLVSRAVRRRTLLAGWFIALGATTLIGLVAAAGLGWAAVSSVSRPPDGLTFGLHTAAIGCGALAATALGLLVGALVPFRPAIVLALVLCAALG
ncbi:MAG: ABC transporter permease subunit, partial [Thermoleophilaceae bacterium]